MIALLRQSFLQNRLPLFLFWALTGLYIAVTGMATFSSLPLSLVGRTNYIYLVWGAVTAALIVLRDPVFGDQSAWRTRPISGWLQGLSKLIALTLFIAIPSALYPTLLFPFIGGTGSEFFSGMLFKSVSFLWLLLLVAIPTTFARSLVGAVLVVLVVLVAIFPVVAFLDNTVIQANFSYPAYCALASLVFLIPYVTRNRILTVVAFLAIPAVATTSHRFLPSSAKSPELFPTDQVFSPLGITVQLKHYQYLHNPTFGLKTEAPIPTGFALVPLSFDAKVRDRYRSWPAHYALEDVRQFYPNVAPSGDPSRWIRTGMNGLAAIASALGLKEADMKEPEGVYLHSAEALFSFGISSSFWDREGRTKADDIHLVGTGLAGLQSYIPVARFPLSEGIGQTSRWSPLCHIRLNEVTRWTGRTQFTLRSTTYTNLIYALVLGDPPNEGATAHLASQIRSDAGDTMLTDLRITFNVGDLPPEAELVVLTKRLHHITPFEFSCTFPEKQADAEE